MLEADGYQPYLISPEKGLRSLIKGVLEMAKEPSRLCVDEVILHIVQQQFSSTISLQVPIVVLNLFFALMFLIFRNL